TRIVGTGTRPPRRIRQGRHPDRRNPAHGGRRVSHRVHRQSPGQDRRGLRGPHAAVRGANQRGRPARSRRLPQVALPPRNPMNYLTDGHTLRSWLLTRDHKRIALLYLVSITAFFAIGGAAATLIRLHLLIPEGALLQADTYNKMFTIHGVIMV